MTLALGFRPEPFLEAFPDARCGGVALDYAIEPEPLDTAGAIRFAAEHAGIDDTFVVANGDVLTDLDVGALVAVPPAGRRRGDDPPHPRRRPVGVRRRRARRRSVGCRFVEKPAPGTEPSNLINAGTYVFEPSVLDRIPAGRRVSIERETFPAIAADGRPVRDGDRRLLDRRRAARPVPAGQPRPRSAAPSTADRTSAPTSTVDAVVVDSPVGAGARVGAGATVTRSVILPGATHRRRGGRRRVDGARSRRGRRARRAGGGRRGRQDLRR